MVVVVMADQYEIDLRQIAYRNARWSNAFRTGKGDRAGALRPNRVREDIQAANLYQHGRMVDVGCVNALLNTIGDGRCWGVGKSLWPLRLIPQALPQEAANIA